MNPIRVITIGRSSKNDVVLNHVNVSRVHCQIIQYDNGTFSIVDFRSTNGTYVNGARINGQAVLNGNDRVQVAGVEFAWKQYFNDVVHSNNKSSLPIVLGIVGGAIMLLLAAYFIIRHVQEKKIKENWSFPEVHDIISETLPESSLLYFSPENMYVNFGETMEEAFLRKNRNYYQLIQEYGLGGGKMLAEMSADVCGLNKSKYSEDKCIPLLSLDQLKLNPILPDDDNSPYEIVKLIYSRTIYIDDQIICKPSPVRGLGVFVIDIPVVPYCDNGCEMVVPEGQMIEVEGNDVQNLVVTHTEHVHLEPHHVNWVRVFLDCAARKRGDPTNHRVRLTPFKMVAPSNVYESQNAVWNHIESKKIYPITFYVRPRLEHKSILFNVKDKGHAFVKIPGIGFTGYGSGNGKWIGGEGDISNHHGYYDNNYGVLDSCVVMVTEQQLHQITTRYKDLIMEKKKYYIGHNDCTSFVMDIADAGNIKYGNRLNIQYPSAFLNGIKEYNQ